jgi:hypothetical protein
MAVWQWACLVYFAICHCENLIAKSMELHPLIGTEIGFKCDLGPCKPRNVFRKLVNHLSGGMGP